ncbi:MAG: HU family DNA-binding protein [Planctomycetota bacterium]
MAKKVTKKAAAKPPTKSEIYRTLAEQTDLSRKDVVAVCDALTEQIAKNLKKHSTFNLLGLAKLTVVKKPAVKPKPGEMTRNPFTGEMVPKKAKPASKNVKVRAMKSLKDMVN